MTCDHCFREKPPSGACPVCGFDPGRKPWRPPALPPGTELGGEYRLGRVLGKGGFGITYVALDVNLERRVAVKEFFPSTLAARGPDQTTVVPADEGRFGDWRKRFLEEAKALARLEHAHVVRVLRFFEAGGTAYMVMEYYEGETLAERLERLGRMSPGEAFAVMGPILEALEAAHATKPLPLIHRDVKPPNIFLLAGGRPVLLDFGAARHAAMGDDPKSLSVVLTPGFAPYEQYSRKGAQGPWTDVYGAAATLYRMVTGEDTPDAVDRKDDDHLKPPHVVVPGIGRAFSAAVLRGLAMKPQDRPQTAREFREQLAGALGNAGTLREEEVPTELEPTVIPPRKEERAPGPLPTPPPPPVTQVPPSLVVCPLCGKKNDPRETFQCRECKADDLCLGHQDLKEKICETCMAKRTEAARLKKKKEEKEAEEKRVAEARERERRQAAEAAARREREESAPVRSAPPGGRDGVEPAAEKYGGALSFTKVDPATESQSGATKRVAALQSDAEQPGVGIDPGEPPGGALQNAPVPAAPPRKAGKAWLVWTLSVLALAAVIVTIVLVVQGTNRRGALSEAPTGGPTGKKDTNAFGMAFVELSGGSFTMGSESSEADSDEKPVHRVTLSRSFELQTTEVTQAQWKAVMGSNPSKFQGDDLPVENVSWDDCQAFIQKLNAQDPGKNYRLPIEAEWEYACRAGTTGERYGEVDSIAWYDQNSGGETHPVGQKQPNAWGLYDMLGNVWEWCADWHGGYPSGSVTDPAGPTSGSYRVGRGGGWYNNARSCRAAHRSNGIPGDRGSLLGFRLARDSAR